ncbi:MAG: sugar phosphate nucleotidyltransferase [Pseudomonadota bacterium]
MARIYPVIMAGGSGTRLWPVSRAAFPKQFRTMLGEKSMFQDTISRVSGHAGRFEFAAPSVIGGERYGELIEGQMAEIGAAPGKILLEPFGRNTAAVAAMAAAIPDESDALVLLLPSDAYMDDPQAFRDAVGAAAETASEGFITTFGIKPTHAETGFGYILRGDAIEGDTFALEAFKEKPDPETAYAYFKDGRYTWNAGIFLFSKQTMIDELLRHAPAIQDGTLAAMSAGRPLGEAVVLNPDLFGKVDEDSIDYAVMENTERGAVHGPIECGWNDIGSWSAISDLSNRKTTGDVIAIDTDGCYLRSDGETLITAVGVTDLIVVAHEGSVLILPKDRAQDVKAIINQLKADGRKDRL